MVRNSRADGESHRPCLGEKCPYRIELRRLKFAAAAALAPADRAPRYDTKTGILRVGNAFIRRFRTRGKQHLVLAEFQRLGWPPSIEVPEECEPFLVEHRDRDVVCLMNKRHRCPLIEFHACDGGLAVSWEPVGAAAGAKSSPETTLRGEEEPKD